MHQPQYKTSESLRLQKVSKSVLLCGGSSGPRATLAATRTSSSSWAPPPCARARPPSSRTRCFTWRTIEWRAMKWCSSLRRSGSAGGHQGVRDRRRLRRGGGRAPRARERRGEVLPSERALRSVQPCCVHLKQTWRGAISQGAWYSPLRSHIHSSRGTRSFMNDAAGHFPEPSARSQASPRWSAA